MRRYPVFRLWLLLCLLPAILNAQRPKRTVRQRDTVPVTQPGNLIRYSQIKTKKDSIPLNRRVYYQVDPALYKKYLATHLSDSVRLVKADKKDWNDFDQAYQRLQKVIETDSLHNARDYLNEDAFSELKLVNEQFLPNTAKVCIRQLTFNLDLASGLLSRPIANAQDLRLLSMSLDNIDVLTTKYVMPLGQTMLYDMRVPTLKFRVVDSTGTEIKNVRCYLVTPKTCRDINCKSCSITDPACNPADVMQIIEKNDRVFDCMNDSSVPVYFGRYHVFVIGNNNILLYELQQVDENSLAGLQDNVITYTLPK